MNEYKKIFSYNWQYVTQSKGRILIDQLLTDILYFQRTVKDFEKYTCLFRKFSEKLN